jgi:glycerophosphoryl diester phosphodiesterase
MSLAHSDFDGARMLNFAHRGARIQAPENTLPAFKRAAELGADGIELDVHLSLDSIPVVIHDGYVDKTTDGSGPVGRKSLAELGRLDAGAWFSPQSAGTRIPTLEEVLDEVGQQLLINIELKAGGPGSRLVENVVDVVRRSGMTRRVMFSSFDLPLLRQARRLAPEIPVGYLYVSALFFPMLRGWIARSMLGPHEAHHPHFSSVNERYMAWARKHKLRVHVWTVNEVDDIRRMTALGVDMIMSDYPDRVRDVMSNKSEIEGRKSRAKPLGLVKK